MIYHILPINDTAPHDETSACECMPTIQFIDNGDMLVIHNSYDGREIIEALLDDVNKEGDEQAQEEEEV